ncbi:DDE-type integrase/transposase/recombinase [Thalassotalea sp. PS06]|uniref:DDE-type integrase/transposase/recombinase n=1 Tax=Thalassotalea sp. PS06 TaxID=2594005 RepID=UPI0011649217|nr:DDE-type integrase/transposase/recombinase [Thalassotalea sp. PS06]QDP00234.1 transposase family protein [Thalassotalea sp. PS06]
MWISFKCKLTGIGGIPDEFMLDNGTAYTANRVLEFITQLTDLKFARAHHGDDKPHVERFFGTLITHFLETYPGYMPKRFSRNSAEAKEIGKKKLWTFDEFERELKNFLDDYNHREDLNETR